MKRRSRIYRRVIDENPLWPNADDSNLLASLSRRSLYYSSPYDFGAVLDGVTDDTVAMQAWLNTGAEGKLLIAPHGTSCYVTSELKYNSGVHLWLYGLTFTVPTSSNFPILVPYHWYNNTGNPQGNTHIYGFNAIGTGNYTNTSQRGIILMDDKSYVRDVYTDEMGGAPVYLTHKYRNGTTYSGNLVNNHIHNVQAYHCYDYGFYGGDSGNNKITDGSLVNITIDQKASTTVDAVYIGSGAGWTVDTIHPYSAGKPDYAVSVANGYNTTIRNIYVERYRLAALRLGALQQNVNVQGVTAIAANADASSSAILLDKSAAVSSVTVNIDDVNITQSAATSVNMLETLNDSVSVNLGKYQINGANAASVTPFKTVSGTPWSNIKRRVDFVGAAATPSANDFLSHNGTNWVAVSAATARTNMGLGSYEYGVFTATASKTVANTTTETSIIGTGVGSLTLSANTLTVGKTIRISISGIFSTRAIAAGNLTVRAKLGSTTIATIVITNLVASTANGAFDGWLDIVCRSTGASGTVMCNGKISYDIAAFTQGMGALNNVGATSTIDTTASQTLDITVQWATADTSNTVTSTTAMVEAFN